MESLKIFKPTTKPTSTTVMDANYEDDESIGRVESVTIVAPVPSMASSSNNFLFSGSPPSSILYALEVSVQEEEEKGGRGGEEGGRGPAVFGRESSWAAAAAGLNRVTSVAYETTQNVLHRVARKLSQLEVLKPVEDLDKSPYEDEKPTMQSFYRTIFNSLPMLFLALLLITIAEDQSIKQDKARGHEFIAIWPIFYEIISAYGTVGLSYGR